MQRSQNEYIELLAPKDEPQEEEAGEQATAEEVEGPATGERAAEGEHEEDEEVSATEAGGAEGSNESVGADGAEEFFRPTGLPGGRR